MTNTNKVVTQSAGQTDKVDSATKDDLAPISIEEYENENQLRDLKKAMEIDAQIAVQEGLEKQEQEKEDDARAAREAARDLGIDPDEDDNKKNDEDEDQKVVSKAISNTDSLVSVMRGSSLHQLTKTESGLDSLLGATSALEMAEDDPKYLERYSERVAAEADESNEAHK